MDNLSPIPAAKFDPFFAVLMQAPVDFDDFLKSLDADEIRELDKMGDHFKEFVKRALEFIVQYPASFPAELKPAEKLEAFKLYEQTNQLADMLQALATGFRNMSYLAGAEAKGAGLQGYGLMEMLGRTNPIMAAEHKELKKFFDHAKKDTPDS